MMNYYYTAIQQKFLKKAKEYNINPNDIYLSWLKSKKYILLTPENKIVHFGYMGMEDGSKHNDSTRREAFLKRNKKWKDYSKYTPAWLSYHLTW